MKVGFRASCPKSGKSTLPGKPAKAMGMGHFQPRCLASHLCKLAN
jgi:hypothetical protein